MRTLSFSVLVMTALLTSAAMAETTPAPAGGDKPVGMHDGMPPKGGHGFGGPMKGADTDKDGALSQQEFAAKTAARFKEMDANHDGKVTPEEARAFHEKMREMHGEKRQERLENRQERIEKRQERRAGAAATDAPAAATSAGH